MSVECGKFAATEGCPVSRAKIPKEVREDDPIPVPGRASIHARTGCAFTSTRAQKISGSARTKILEGRLRQAQELLLEFHAGNPSEDVIAKIDGIFHSPPGSPSSRSQLESMMDGTGRLAPVRESMQYYGGGSCFAFLLQTLHLFGQDSSGLGNPNNADFIDAISRLFDAPLPGEQALATEVELLPPRRTASELLQAVFGQTYQLLHFVHEPTFQQQVDRIYDIDCMIFEDTDHAFLPLFYSVAALGYLCHRKMHEQHGCDGAINQA